MRVVATLLGGLLLSAACATHAANAPSNAEPTRYLAFQIFRVDSGAAEMSANIPPSEDLLTVVRGLRDRIGMTGSHGRKLGFIIGPVSFDTPDDAARATIRQMFDVSLRTGVAGGIHIDDSMFWGRLTELNSIDSIEWLDWKMTPNRATSRLVFAPDQDHATTVHQ